MGFEPTTLHSLAECANHRATVDSLVGKGQLKCRSPVEAHRLVTQPNNDLSHMNSHNYITLRNVKDTTNQPPK